MPFLFRIIAPLLFICACLLGFMAIGGLGNIDLKVAQFCVAVCIALSLLAGVLFRFSFQRTSGNNGAVGKWPAVLELVTSQSTMSASASAPLADKVATPAPAQAQ